MTFEELQKANQTIKTTDIKGKSYAEVNQRIKAFRMCYPEGFIRTNMIGDCDGRCIFTACVGYYTENGDVILGTGTAYEKEDSSFINQTSYIENCETSAVGRALGMAGFGIDTSVASAEEVQNAMLNQDEEPVRKASERQIEILLKAFSPEKLQEMLTKNKIEKIEDLPMKKANEYISYLKGEKK